MPHLYFNPYYSLYSLSSIDNGPTYPFMENDRVRMNLDFGAIIDASPTHSDEADRLGFHMKRYAWLLPVVNPVGEYLMGQVTRIIGPPLSQELSFSYDLESVLQAVLLQDSPQDEFPFRLGQVVTMQLVVRKIHRLSAPRSSRETWGAILVPDGGLLDGLVLSNVEAVNH